MAFCIKCGHELDQEARFCAVCGAPVRETQATPQPAATSAQAPTPTSEPIPAPTPAAVRPVRAAPPSPTPPRKWWGAWSPLKRVGIVVGSILAVCVVLFVIIGVTADVAQDDGGAADDKQTPELAWQTIAQWQGKATKNTETFHIPSKEWRISWDTRPGSLGDFNFQLFVYTADGDLRTVAANVIGADQDSSTMRGSGDYYLTINTAQPYTVEIEALLP